MIDVKCDARENDYATKRNVRCATESNRKLLAAQEIVPAQR